MFIQTDVCRRDDQGRAIWTLTRVESGLPYDLGLSLFYYWRSVMRQSVGEGFVEAAQVDLCTDDNKIVRSWASDMDAAGRRPWEGVNNEN